MSSIVYYQDIGEKFKKFIIQEGDILIAMSGATTGKIGIYSEDYPAYLNQRVGKFIKKPYNDKKFIFYVITQDHIQSQIIEDAIGGAQPNISAKHIENIYTLIPPLPEQKKIAEILTAWDKAISTTDSLVENSRQQKKALMQQLLTGKKRLAGFSEEWKKYKLKDVGEILSGGTPDTSTKEFWDGGIPWVTPSEITNIKNKYIGRTKRNITEIGVKNSSAIILPQDTLLVCSRATIGNMAISKCRITTNQGLKNIVPSKNFNVLFLYYTISNNIKLLIEKASGSTFLEISKRQFEELTFSFPPLPEQRAIAAVLTAADREIALLEQKAAGLREEKKALMQQLLTGKKRVSVA